MNNYTGKLVVALWTGSRLEHFISAEEQTSFFGHLDTGYNLWCPAITGLLEEDATFCWHQYMKWHRYGVKMLHWLNFLNLIGINLANNMNSTFILDLQLEFGVFSLYKVCASILLRLLSVWLPFLICNLPSTFDSFLLFQPNSSSLASFCVPYS